MATETLLPKILELSTSPGAVVAAALAGLPIAVGAVRSAWQFRTEFVRHRFESSEKALAGLRPEDADYDLLSECKAEEAVYLSTGIRASRPERAVIKEWVTNKPVSVSLVRRAWPQIGWSGRTLLPSLSPWERFYMWWTVCTASLLLFIGLGVLAVGLPAILKGALWILAIPLATTLFSALMIKQIDSLLSTRKLQRRLEDVSE